MKQYPSIPRAEDAPPDLFESGHLWIQELVAGGHLRFRLLDSGVFEFGDRERTFDPDDVPLPYRHAVRHVREQVERAALRSARDDPASVVCFGVATFRRGLDYDWDRIPSFLGFDVWDANEEQFLPPDAVEQVYDRLGLRAVNTFRKEVRASDFDPASYEVPASAWYDGPAAGVVVRNKTGGRATISGSGPADAPSEGEADASVADVAAEYVTRERVDAVVRELESRGRPATFDPVFERVVEAVVREERLFREDGSGDAGAFRSEVAARTQELLET